MRALTLAVLLLAACGAPPSRSAPEFSLPDASGKLHALSSYKGRAVLVTFWATWCPTCVEEIPALQALEDRLGRRGLSVLGVSLDDDFAAATPFARKLGAKFPILDGDARVQAAYAVRALPVLNLIDADGKIVRRWNGPVDAATIENDILPLLSKEAP
jgi:cytochrome c biogenesis protein CcmG, thiol:disulfide interchange protein DsbE